MLSVRYPKTPRQALSAASLLENTNFAGAGVRVRAGFSAVLDEKLDFDSSAVQASDTTDCFFSTISTNPASQSTDRGGLTAKMTELWPHQTRSNLKRTPPLRFRGKNDFVSLGISISLDQFYDVFTKVSQRFQYFLESFCYGLLNCYGDFRFVIESFFPR